ncbi:ABC transporter B family member 20-like protein [Tanacetum coccineum]
MRGVDLTPGQKQRIAIARVVLKNAPILLLDEASSSIESESSRVVQEALDTLVMGNKTTILIAHRAAMMRHVDNIVVLNGGKIVEEGSHDSLMGKNVLKEFMGGDTWRDGGGCSLYGLGSSGLGL